MRRKKAITAYTDLVNGTTEGKTTIKPLVKVVQAKKKLNSPIFIAGFPGAGLVGSIRYQLHYQQTSYESNSMCRI